MWIVHLALRRPYTFVVFSVLVLILGCITAVVTICERAMTTTVNDIEQMASQSYAGVAIIKVFFQPRATVELAISQVTSIVQTILRALPQPEWAVLEVLC